MRVRLGNVEIDLGIFYEVRRFIRIKLVNVKRSLIRFGESC